MKAQMISEGKDPAEIETKERIQYKYCNENYDLYVENLSKKQTQATTMSETKQAIIQKMYGDVIVGKYYNVQMRGESNKKASDMHNGALLFDPVFFEEDTGERK